jgi:hypothetical protein
MNHMICTFEFSPVSYALNMVDRNPQSLTVDLFKNGPFFKKFFWAMMV